MSGFFTDTHKDYPDAPKPEVEKFSGIVPSVSFSSMSTFEQCPYAVYLSKVCSIRGLGSPATDRGSKLHELLEEYVLGTTDEINWKQFKSGKFHAPIIDQFRELYQQDKCVPELKIAFTKEMQLTKWDADDCWLRGAIDVTTYDTPQTAKIYDYKSGNNASAAKHRAQLMLYAMMLFLSQPEVQTIEAAAIYLDHKITNFYTSYRRSDVNLYWPRYQQRLARVTDCRDFQPNPNAFSCRWCQHKTIQEELGQVEPACKFAYV